MPEGFDEGRAWKKAHGDVARGPNELAASLKLFS